MNSIYLHNKLRNNATLGVSSAFGNLFSNVGLPVVLIKNHLCPYVEYFGYFTKQK